MNKGLKSCFMLLAYSKTVAADSLHEFDFKVSQMLFLTD